MTAEGVHPLLEEFKGGGKKEDGHVSDDISSEYSIATQ